MRHSAVLLTAALVATGTATSAMAGPRPKPVTKTYTATVPNPTIVGIEGAIPYRVCNRLVPGSFHDEPFTVPRAGTLTVTLTGFVGDWDLVVVDSDDLEVARDGHADATGQPETLTALFAKKRAVVIRACNYTGGPTGTVTYRFTSR